MHNIMTQYIGSGRLDRWWYQTVLNGILAQYIGSSRLDRW